VSCWTKKESRMASSSKDHSFVESSESSTCFFFLFFINQAVLFIRKKEKKETKMGDKATPSQTKLKSTTTTIITHMDENKT